MTDTATAAGLNPFLSHTLDVTFFVRNPNVPLTVGDYFRSGTAGRHNERFSKAEVNTGYVHSLIQAAASPAFLWHSGPPR